MPPKTAKKKETVEQREARLAMEAVAAQEAEQHRAELARVKLRDVAAREHAAARVNSRLLAAEWLQRMRQAKMETLRSEASALARTHDWECDRRDRRIEGLLDDLGSADEQRSAATEAHAEVVGRLLELYEGRVVVQHKQFLADLKDMQQEFEGERAEMVAAHNRRRKELADTVQALEVQYAEALAAAASGYSGTQEGLRSQAAEAYNVMKLSLEQRIAELEAQVEAQHAAYVEATHETEAAYRQLAGTDERMTAAIKQRTERLQDLHASLGRWRGAIMTNNEEWRRRNAALAGEKEAVLARHTALKAKLAKHRRGHQEALRRMCVAAGQAQAQLRHQLEAARRVLGVVELCCKLELPQDKGVAGAEGEAASQAATDVAAESPDASQEACSSKGSLEQAAQQQQQQQQQADSTKPLPVDDSAAAIRAGLGVLGLSDSCSHLLAALGSRANRVELDRLALEQQQLQLAAENAALQRVLDSIEAGQTLRHDAVDGPLNTLLVVNFGLQRALRGQQGGS